MTSVNVLSSGSSSSSLNSLITFPRINLNDDDLVETSSLNEPELDENTYINEDKVKKKLHKRCLFLSHSNNNNQSNLLVKSSLVIADDEIANGDKLNQTKVSLTNSLTDVSEDLINQKSNEIGRVTKWATGFERLLEDQAGLQIFTEFLKKEFSEENINFWVICENHKKLTDPIELKKSADEIWNSYLDTSSAHQINVDNKARSHCKEAFQNPNNTMFEMAQTQIFTLMKYDSYARFLKSQMYKDCIINEMAGKPLLSSNMNTKFKNGLTNSKLFSENMTDKSVKTNQNSNSTLNLNSMESNHTSNNLNENQSTIPGTSSNVAASSQNHHLTSDNELNASANNQSIANDQTLNRKEKKKSMIIPWTKALIKWKRLSGKDKKPCDDNSILSFKKEKQDDLETSTNTSLSLSNQLDGKFCRVLYNNDGSSSILQLAIGQNAYQALSKLFVKKNMPWYKCDLNFLGDYQPVDPLMDTELLATKEICLSEKCLFVLSLIPIAINLCVKANFKKTIGSILIPILDNYQIKLSNCAIYLNSNGHSLNLNDLCSKIDNQNVLVVHKNQSNLLSQMEIDRFMKVSITDIIPSNVPEYEIKFDNLGILKQFVPTKKTPTIIPNDSKLPLKSVDEEKAQKNMIDLLRKAQNYSLDDQRGKIDSRNLEIPEFLLTSNLIKNQLSMSQNFGDFNKSLNKSTLSLPFHTANSNESKEKETLERYVTPSRSPILIVYDNEEVENCSLNENIDIDDKLIDESRFPHQLLNEHKTFDYKSNELDSQTESTKPTPNTTQISYV